jgi:hypothetical protein
MRKFPLVSVLLFLTLLGNIHAKDPDFRPALMIQGSSGLANLIDGESLMKQGQGTAMVHFTVRVSTGGSTRLAVTASGNTIKAWTIAYGGTSNADRLQREVANKIDRAIFYPAIYRGTPQAALIFGTVVFAVVEGKPHVRVYLNQDFDEIKSNHDFIAPQLVLLPGTKFKGVDWPQKAPYVPATVGIRMNIDATGKITGMNLEYESPKGMDFGGQTMMDLKDATFMPGYRNGKPVSCSFSLPFHFRGGWSGSQWNPN